ncbi:MAG TPA: arginase [Candidatus Sulfotelmatobacter sp.]|nr:arginase [Candidatus Sulfotelmatobacter sp.]
MLCKILGAPVDVGAGLKGCDRAPQALRAAGFAAALRRQGHRVADLGDAAQPRVRPISHPNAALKALPAVAAWTAALTDAAYAASADGLPIFLGGDHSMAAGTIAGLARRAAEARRPLFVLWLDAHPDFHTLDSSQSGNLHGVPLAYVCGRPGFAGYFPALAAPVDPARVCLFGVRSIDPAEADTLPATGMAVHDMRAIETRGVAALLGRFLERVRAARGLLHVSFDIDCLDPAIAPAVGTAVSRGIGLRDAHAIADILRDSGLVGSLDLVELNPALDAEGRTAALMIDLTTRLVGRAAGRTAGSDAA